MIAVSIGNDEEILSDYEFHRRYGAQDCFEHLKSASHLANAYMIAEKHKRSGHVSLVVRGGAYPSGHTPETQLFFIFFRKNRGIH